MTGGNNALSMISQSGRSMVEMLGTLAIIGVLSIGGIMGYSYGMDKYRANETMQAVTLRGIDVLAQFDRTGDANLNEWKNERGVFPAHIKNILTFIFVRDIVPLSLCWSVGRVVMQRIANPSSSKGMHRFESYTLRQNEKTSLSGRFFMSKNTGLFYGDFFEFKSVFTLDIYFKIC